MYTQQGEKLGDAVTFVYPERHKSVCIVQDLSIVKSGVKDYHT